jgi:dUTP pyrophosphatase
MKIEIKKLHENAKIPQYQTVQSAGFDLVSIEDITIKPNQRVLIGTGLAMAIEDGFELQIRPRSGLAYKNGITVLNSPGTIDSDYRGEIKVLLINHSEDDFNIKTGDRIAQAVVQKVYQASFEIVEELEQTVRGSGGFGSKGV